MRQLPGPAETMRAALHGCWEAWPVRERAGLRLLLRALMLGHLQHLQ
jgi:hypothetical protein